MTERIGDIPMDERLDSGRSELFDFMPNGHEDAITHINRSATKQKLWYERDMRAAHQSTSRFSQYKGVIEAPDHVVRSIIRMGDRTWDYQTGTTPNNIRRVFTERNQAIELDVDDDTYIIDDKNCVETFS